LIEVTSVLETGGYTVILHEFKYTSIKGVIESYKLFSQATC